MVLCWQVVVVLLKLLHTEELHLHLKTAAAFALAEACTAPTAEMVTALGTLLSSCQVQMLTHCKEVAAAQHPDASISLAERAKLTS